MKNGIFAALFCIPLLLMGSYYETDNLIDNQVATLQNWAKTYGTPLNDEALSMVETHDGYIIAGHTSSATTDILIIKINNQGNVLWAKQYDGGWDDYAFSIIETKIPGPTPTYEYLVAGYTNSGSVGTNFDFLVMKINDNGIPLWSCVYGGGGDDYAYSIGACELLGGFRYIVSGFSYSFGATADALAIYLDFNGNILGAGAYDTGGDDKIYSVDCSLTATGHEFVLAGFTNPGFFGGEDILIFKIDETFSFSPIWAKEYAAVVTGTSLDDRVYYMKREGNGYVCVGYSNTPPTWDMLAMKTDLNGGLQWLITYDGGNNDYARCIDKINGGYLISGDTFSCGATSRDLIVVKIDDNGNFINGKILENGNAGNCHIPLTGEEYGYFIAESAGEYAVGGCTDSVGIGGYDFLVTRNFQSIYPPCCQRNCTLEATKHKEYRDAKMWMSGDEIFRRNIGIRDFDAEIIERNFCSRDNCIWSEKGDNLIGWYYPATEPIGLPSTIPIKLDFYVLGGTRTDEDGGFILLSSDGGDTWVTLFNLSKLYPTWTKIECDLSQWAGEEVIIKFEYFTGLDSYSPGWYVDDLLIKARDLVIFYEDFNGYPIDTQIDDWKVVEKPEKIEPDTTPPSIELTKPKKGIVYIGDDGKIDMRDIIAEIDFALIIGEITIEANAQDKESGLKEIGIYIDELLGYTTTYIPPETDDEIGMSWTWDETVFGFHTITIKASDDAGNVGSTEPLKVLIFNIS